MRAPSPLVRGWAVPRWGMVGGDGKAAEGDAGAAGGDASSVGGDARAAGGEAQLAEPDMAFPYDDTINQRFAIWQGDITCLEVDVIATTIEESMPASGSSRLLLAAGPGLRDEIVSKGLEAQCMSGAVCVSRGHSLPARYVLHARAARYCPPSPPAAGSPASPSADTELYNCYREVLSQAGALAAGSLALGPLHARGFPPHLAAAVALRAVRAHLSAAARPALVLLVRLGPPAALLQLAPAAFPRRPRPHPRRIRIIHNPHQHPRTADEDATPLDEEAAVEAAAAFARACDTQRLLAPDNYRVVTHHSEDRDQYERLLRRAHSEDLSEVSGIGCLYQSGVDRLGRPVVVFIGKWFPIGEIDLDKALLYLMKLLDPLVRGDYVLVYFHTLAASGNHPPFSWLKEVYTVLPYKYKKNLKAFYIVHPTFWTKMMTWWFTTFMAPAIKAKVHTLPGLEYLYSVMTRDQLQVPAFVTEYDMTINGLHYFQPDVTSTT